MTSIRRMQLRYEAEGGTLQQLIYHAHRTAEEAFGSPDVKLLPDTVRVEIGLVHAVSVIRSEDGPPQVRLWRADVTATGDLG